MPPLLLLWALLGGPAEAAAPTEAGVRVLLKVLSYDRALRERQTDGEHLVVGVAFDPSDPISAANGAEVTSALRSLKGTTVSGLVLVEPSALPEGRTSWPDALKGVSAVVACQGVDLAALSAAAADVDRPVLSLTDVGAGQGAAVALGLRQARLHILLDRNRALDQGMDPSGELLEVAELVQ
ncbi:MAG: YfiR/HmsC family protein [Myxococcota bacterium]